MPGNNSNLEKRLWDAADELRANSKLTSFQYSAPVLGLIFLRYADARFAAAQAALAGRAAVRRKIGRIDYQEQGVMYLPDSARFSCLNKLSGGGSNLELIVEIFYPYHG